MEETVKTPGGSLRTLSPLRTREEVTENMDVLCEAEKNFPVNEMYGVPAQNRSRCHVPNNATYQEMYAMSLEHPNSFWKGQADSYLRWIAPFTHVSQGSFEHGDMSWFLNGKLNACDNCVDRWAEATPNNVAVIWEGDEPGDVKKVTYSELLRNVCRVANMLKSIGVRKYDTVVIYAPMMLETLYTMLACARLGAVHSVVFAGFSAANLRDRILDSGCKVVVTADCGMRGGRQIPLKSVMDEALIGCDNVKTCIMFERTGTEVNWVDGRDINGTTFIEDCRPYCPVEIMDSEDLLFLLYTSGSTGKAKGIAHTTAGYLLQAAMSFKLVFDYHPGDVYACLADVAWITGHSYIVYGPLACGATTFMFESVPTYPDAGRYWDVVQRHKITQLYTAPTVIRTLMRFGPEVPEKYDLSSLRILGSVGEPINPEAWRWYHEHIGRKRCSIVDTYWQTETGAHLLTPLPGACSTKPGSAVMPFFGIDPVIVDPVSGRELTGNSVSGVLCIRKPWPGMMRSVYHDHQRMLNVYFKPFPGLYFTGDGAVRDKDGYLFISGRIDDTINVSGHRLGSAEIEHAIVQHPKASECAVVGYPHPIKGSGIFAFVTLKADVESLAVQEIKDVVRKFVGPLANPDFVVFTPALPKTRSGKIMRRLLRKIACNEHDQLGDVTTLADPSAIELIVNAVQAQVPAQQPKK